MKKNMQNSFEKCCPNVCRCERKGDCPNQEASWLTLVVNYFLFSWYYKRVPEHFRQWTFFKSVKLLIENYRSHKDLADIYQRDYMRLVKEVDDLKSQMIVKDKMYQRRVEQDNDRRNGFYQ